MSLRTKSGYSKMAVPTLSLLHQTWTIVMESHLTFHCNLVAKKKDSKPFHCYQFILNHMHLRWSKEESYFQQCPTFHFSFTAQPHALPPSLLSVLHPPPPPHFLRISPIHLSFLSLSVIYPLALFRSLFLTPGAR